MAVYPDGNPGATPINPNTDVGKLRFLVNDTESTPYSPVEPGFGNYVYFSDAALQAFVDAAAGDLMLASGYSYQRIAAILTINAKNITTDDLRIQTEVRANTFRLLAKDIIDGANATAAAFDSWALTGGVEGCHCYEYYGHCHCNEYGIV